VVAALEEVPREDLTHLAAAAGNYDAQRAGHFGVADVH
jgi:hypothetical protein